MRLLAEHIHKTFAGDTPLCVINDLTLAVEEGEFVAVLGQSGCGKSTLLRVLGGFERADSGEVTLGGVPVTAPGKEILMVFQDLNQLFPWKTLKQNIRYAIKKTTRPFDKERAELLAEQCIAEMGLVGFADSYPHQLSGGMKQRGAMARAIALQPQVLLMDEPFSSLDYLTRRNAQDTLLALWRKDKISVVFVTHDIDEALYLAQKIAVYNQSTRRISHIFCNNGTEPELKTTLEQLLRGA